MEDNFPAGIRVLAVDHDSTCLVILETMLRQCQYNVTPIKRASKALDILRQNNNNFDLVMCDIVHDHHMPADKPDHDVDGFQLLRKVSLEMDIPVVIMSSVDDKKVIMKCINDGASDYLIKPLRIEEIKNIWQHVFRRKKFGCKVLQLGKNKCEGAEYMISCEIGAGNRKKKKKKEDDDEDEDLYDDEEEEETTTPHKKRRVIWTPELHQKFLAAVNQLGIDKAVPKRILELMHVDNITRENVASHLQKHRMNLKKLTSREGTNYNSTTSGSAYADNTVEMSTPPAAQHMQPAAAAGYINIPYADDQVSSSGLIIPQSQWGQAQPAADYNLHVHGILSMQELQNDTTTDYINAPHPLAAAAAAHLDNINCAMPMHAQRAVCSKQGHVDFSSLKCDRSYIQFPNFCHNTAAQAPTPAPAPTHSYFAGPIQIQHMNIHQQALSSQSFNHDGSYLVNHDLRSLDDQLESA